MKKAFIFLPAMLLGIICKGQFVGIGTSTPTSGLEVKGTGLGSQQRITDPTSGNTLVMQAGAGSNLKVTGYNYTTATAQPLYISVDGANTLVNANGGNLGIGTTNPATKLTVHSNLFGIEHTNGTVSLGTYLSSSGGWIGTKSNHPLYFYTNNSGQLMTLTQAGQLGIGTTTPIGGYLADIAGPVRSFGNTTHFVAQTTGGTNSWARFYMRSTAQSWFIGTSQNFIGNQLYIADETYGITRIAIQPNGGAIQTTGNITQDAGGYGLPKAMIEVGPNGNIIRCYNGVTGTSTVALSGFSVVYTPGSFATPHQYKINFGFYIKNRFFSVTPKFQANPRYATVSNNEDPEATFLTDNEILVINWQGGTSLASTFYVVVY